MKTQSARKHRRAGHIVQRFHDGRYQWQSQGTPQMFGRAVRMGEQLRNTAEMLKRTTIIADTAMFAIFLDPRTIAVGASYWPKRRKPYRVEALSNDGTIYFTRGDRSPTQQIDVGAFLALIGKPV